MFVDVDKGIERTPYLMLLQEAYSSFKDVYGGVDHVVLRAHLLRPPGSRSDTVIIFMHPIGGGEYLPLPMALAKAGHHVIYCQSRYPNNDTALIMEKVALDMAECIRDAKERLGYRRVILGGWSGGGSLALFYQRQAEHPTVTCTPAGDPPNLQEAQLIPADGMLLLAAHVSRALTLTEWLDASILDESNPDVRDPELDLYNPGNPNQAPYSAEFQARYHAAQIARNRRITAWVKSKLAALREQGRPNDEFAFTVHGTMAAPVWLDKSIDPNERKPNSCFLGDPQVVNNGPVGLARFTTLRSWLSQWSYDESNANGLLDAAHMSLPTLLISNGADDACTPSHARRLHDAIAHSNKKLVEIRGATHYYLGQREELREAVQTCTQWLRDQGLTDV
ncbi:MAG: alpha/beta fold hydrolase [Haliea sp.]|nr:alpha/beta fold hydrolase [Haliea sp.]